MHMSAFRGKAQFIAHVRFCGRHPPPRDRKSGHAQKVMSALPPKADICGAIGMSAKCQ